MKLTYTRPTLREQRDVTAVLLGTSEVLGLCAEELQALADDALEPLEPGDGSLCRLAAGGLQGWAGALRELARRKGER